MQRPWIWLIGSLIVTVSITSAAFIAVNNLLEERRKYLVQETQDRVVMSLKTVASLVNERGRDIRNDMKLVIDARHRVQQSPQKIEIVRSHLIALNRSTRNYLRLWHLEDGKIIQEISGFRTYDKPLPDVPISEIVEIDERARNNPGVIAAMQALIPIDSPYNCLRLLGLASKDGKGSVLVLLNMDAAFDSLQRRASLPGLDLYVVDTDGSFLVDPESTRNAEVLSNLLTRQSDGQALLGELPSLWPFSEQGLNAQVLAWRTTAGQPFPWIAAVAAPLADVARQIHQLGVTVLFIAALVLMLAAASAALIFWLVSRESQIKARLEHQNMIERLRAQLLHLEKLSTIGQVAASLAHEMGTPLGVIALRVDQLIEQNTEPKQHTTLAVMRDEIERINRIMRQILDASRPASTEKSKVFITHALNQLANLVGRRYDSCGIKLDIEVNDDDQIFANPDQFVQVLLNILVNANDACSRGDRVLVRTCPKPDMQGRLGIEIIDTGKGIKSEVLPSVFEPFFTTKNKGEGTGLGLTIVREIMQQHDGLVEVFSTEKGTRVVTWWPQNSTAPQDQDKQHELIIPETNKVMVQ
ncbi:MAG: HAMP domain-containing histidine kinase [Deltaproteobacteria bacterium]|nr:HAMP domain-containing histidine kinase [Deltaproteobacteria bacterium]